MQKGVNKVILLGNVGSDPECSRMPSGDAVATNSIATSEQWKDKDTGEKKEKTEWHRAVFFKKLAEVIGQWVKRGDKIYIEGRLQTRSWEKDGVKRYSTEIVGTEMQMLGSKEGKDLANPSDIGGERVNISAADMYKDIPF